MNNLPQGEQLVLPRWLPFWKAANERGFIASRPRNAVASTSLGFDQELIEFKESPAPHIGAELMGLAYVLGKLSVAKELAEYVSSNPELSTIVRKDAATILNGQKTEDIEAEPRLRSLKKSLSDFPNDAMSWIEMARLYTIKAQHKKAEWAATIAGHLAPNDRYIARATIRQLIHSNQWDKALDFGNRTHARTGDPMILGPLLSVATHLNEVPSKLKRIAKLALTAPDSYTYSEALEAIGTVEIKQSGANVARKYFKKAWVDPTIPVIGHSQWVLRDILPGLAAEQSIDFDQSHKAISWLRFAGLKFEGSIQRSRDWELEEPYSSEPYILGSSAACVIGNYQEALEIAKRGIRANPTHPVIRNNLAFAQLKLGQIAEAEKTLTPLISALADKNQVVPVATYGLLLMSKGDIIEGTAQYNEAVKRATSQELKLGVRLNYLLSTLAITGELDESVLSVTTKGLETARDPSSIGVSILLAEKLDMSDLKGSDNLSVAAKLLSETAHTRQKHLMAASNTGPNQIVWS